LYVIEKTNYQAQVAQISATIQRAQATLRLAKVELDRQEDLVKKQVVAQSRVDDARSKYDEASADLTRQQASLDEAKLNLSYTEIRSPIAGRIGRSTYSVGNFVAPSSGTLATIVSPDPIYAVFPVAQRELLAIRKRAETEGTDRRSVKAKLRPGDNSVDDEVGQVNFVDIQVNAETDTVAVRTAFANPKGLLIHGQLVTGIFEFGTPRPAIFVPQQSLQFDQAGYFVLVVDGDNQVKVRR